MRRPDPAHILVAILLPIGDMLFCQPAVGGLRRRYPHAHITALVTPTLATLVAANPDIDDIIVCTARGATDFAELQTVLDAIRQQRYELIISFNVLGNIIALLSGIAWQVWQKLPRGFWLWGALDPAYRERHAIEHYWQVIAPLGIFPQRVEESIPQWQVSAEERDNAHRYLASVGVDWHDERPLVMIHPGAMGFGQSKRWPVDSFGQLANALIAQDLAQVVVLGGAVDVAAADAITAATGERAIALAGRTNLRESIALIANAHTYVGCDSGLTQFAVALGVPTVALYGVSHLAQFAPRAADPSRLRVLLPDPSREPIGYFIGTESLLVRHDYEHDARMASLTVDRVLAAVLDLNHQAETVLASSSIAG